LSNQAKSPNDWFGTRLLSSRVRKVDLLILEVDASDILLFVPALRFVHIDVWFAINVDRKSRRYSCTVRMQWALVAGDRH
jgi:hypothetical protein